MNLKIVTQEWHCYASIKIIEEVLVHSGSPININKANNNLTQLVQYAKNKTQNQHVKTLMAHYIF